MDEQQLAAARQRAARAFPVLQCTLPPVLAQECPRLSGDAPVALSGPGSCLEHGNALALSAHLELEPLPCVECWLEAAAPELLAQGHAILEAADPSELLAQLKPSLLRLEFWLAPRAVRWRPSADKPLPALRGEQQAQRIVHVRPALMAFQQPGAQGLAWTWIETRSQWALLP